VQNGSISVIFVVRELLEESDYDLSSFKEFDDTDEDNTYLPPNSPLK